MNVGCGRRGYIKIATKQCIRISLHSCKITGNETNLTPPYQSILLLKELNKREKEQNNSMTLHLKIISNTFKIKN